MELMTVAHEEIVFGLVKIRACILYVYVYMQSVCVLVVVKCISFCMLH